MGKPNSKTLMFSSLRVVFASKFTSYFILNKIGIKKQTRGTETSQYPEERTSTETPLVVASERGSGQWQFTTNQNKLGSLAIVGDSPV